MGYERVLEEVSRAEGMTIQHVEASQCESAYWIAPAILLFLGSE